MSASPSPEGLAEVLRQLVSLAQDEQNDGDRLAAPSEGEAGLSSRLSASSGLAEKQGANGEKMLDL